MAAAPAINAPDDRARLVLCFDVNKTIVFKDPAGKITTQQMANSVLSESAWGTLASADAGIEGWTLLSTEPTENSPEPANPLVKTFADVVEASSLEYRERKQLKCTFTEAGRAGEMLRPWYERLIAQLTLPFHLRRKMQEMDICHDGLLFILPAFYRTIIWLVEQRRDFQLVFRTFGTDIPVVAREWNFFCSGQHPLYPHIRFDGTAPEGTLGAGYDLRLQLPHSTARVVRTKPGAAGVSLAYVSASDVLSLAVGREEVFDVLRSNFEAGMRSMALQDDWKFWFANKEASDCGKLFVVDPRDPEFHPIFFDDNIERDYAHIVDARDLKTGESLPFEMALGLYLVRVLPIEAVFDHEYFIKEIESCEARRRKLRHDEPLLFSPTPRASVGGFKWPVAGGPKSL
eukprot:m.84031 g.84031  ORF g.84031 m.84031 type:complete len:402 (-) comp8327_c0_seq2:984-2189(-)